MDSDIKQRTFQFALRIMNLCQNLERSTIISQTLAKQLLRSGTSIGANVEEAQGAQSKADFIAKLCIALKETRETHYWLRLLQASKTTLPVGIIDESHQLVAILTSIVKNSRKNNDGECRTRNHPSFYIHYSTFLIPASPG